MKVDRLEPIGFCYGVKKALARLKEIKNDYSNNQIYLFGPLIHNDLVMKELENEGIKVVDYRKENAIELLNKFKKDEIVFFSAHGHDKKYEEVLTKNEVKYFDLTCDIIKKNLSNIINNKEKEIIFIGDKNHHETIASLSYGKNIFLYDKKDGDFDYSRIKTKNPLVLNQTTLSFVELKKIFDDIKKNIPEAIFTDELCNTARLRQEKTKSYSGDADLFIIIGDKKSSNTTKLYELANEFHQDKKILFLNSIEELKNVEIKKYKKAILISGTSAPNSLVDQIELYLKEI